MADLRLSANDYFRFLLIESYSERSDHVADLSPLENGYFRFLLIDPTLSGQMWQSR